MSAEAIAPFAGLLAALGVAALLVTGRAPLRLAGLAALAARAVAQAH